MHTLMHRVSTRVGPSPSFALHYKPWDPAWTSTLLFDFCSPCPWWNIQFLYFPTIALVFKAVIMTTSQPAKYSTFAYAYHGEVIAAGAVFPAVATIIVGLRFWTRSRQNANFGADDWLMIPALVCEKPCFITTF